ncbi:transcriptional regulator, TetR family [Candidatus Scalindua japonica]|uniref:Transcriptional regulator, TetR family n=1 Tax=Candidatus Scalindua japonica TaxID=1284222 RepID=A0A286U085_9BACT|nr:TetR/AcrR family transcriptional regulator [Candidatus Scalindua japonica]GAX61536.1 transcriptional regulator, TetR family [Candidatus Scalindua japonica]
MADKKSQETQKNSKEIILRSAKVLFAKQGFALTTVREIAGKAGINIAMVYYYFNTKEELHQNVIDDAFKSFFQSLKEGVAQGKEPEEKIYDIIKIYITFLHHHKDLHRIILRETISQSKHIDIIVKKYISKNFDLVHDIIKEGIQKGTFRKHDSTLSTFSLIGMILYYFTYEPIFTRLISPEKRKKPITEFLPEHIFTLFMEGVKS